MIEYISISSPCQIEISMLRQVNNRGLISSGFIVNDQFILISKRVGDFDI